MNYNMMFPKPFPGLMCIPGQGLLPTPVFNGQQGTYPEYIPLLPSRDFIQNPINNKKVSLSKQVKPQVKPKVKPKTREYGIGRSLNGVYMIIHNIPNNYKSVELRSFFSQFIETGGFVCFHFTHRPEVQNGVCMTTCCVIKVDTEREHEFIKTYDGVHWNAKDGVTEDKQCCIKKITIDDSVVSIEEKEPRMKKRTHYRLSADCDTFHSKDFDSFIELCPPVNMPHGNVGTTLSYFLEEKAAGKLRPRVARKLGLNNSQNEKNSEVPESTAKKMKKQKNELQGKPKGLSRKEKKLRKERLLAKKMNKLELKKDKTEKEQKKDKKRKEQRKEQKEKRRLKKERRRMIANLRRGEAGNSLQINASGTDCDKMEAVEAVRIDEFAGFDKYSNGIGRKLMEALGWKPGQGIGKNCNGMSEPLMCGGQKPTMRSGFGYEVEKKKKKPVVQDSREDLAKCSLSVSTTINLPLTSMQDSVFSGASDAKLKYQKEFVKSQEVETANEIFH